MAGRSDAAGDGRGRTAAISRRGFLGVTAGTALLGASQALGSRGTGVAGAASRARAGGGFPNPPPIQVLTQPGASAAPGDLLLTPQTSPNYQAGLLVVSPDGKTVVKFISMAQVATTLDVQDYKGQPRLTWWKGGFKQPGYGAGTYRIADANFNILRTVRAGNGLKGDLHEFYITPQNTALITAYQQIPKDLRPVNGPQNGLLLESYFQEVDIRTGKVLLQWQASQHDKLRASFAPLPTDPTTMPWDWFHINSVCLDQDGNILVSGRHTWTVYKVNRKTGAVMWRLGGRQNRNQFTMGQGAAFAWQHHVRSHPNGVLTIFDNGNGPTQVHPSRGLMLEVDETTRTATVLHEYLPPTPRLSTFMGSVQILPNGNVFVGWGGANYFTEYDPTGANVLYDAKLPQGVLTYRAFKDVMPTT